MKLPFKKNSKKDRKKSNTGIDNTIQIRVYMRFGGKTRDKRAEYEAVEKRDNYNNLVAINKVMQHNEDVDFSQEDVYSAMNITLGISGLDKKDKIKKIDQQILKYEKRVQALEKHPELNAYANIWDQKRKLRELTIYKRYIENRSSDGVFYKLENGRRVYEYESNDGFLIPIWHGVDDLTDYPDYTRKKKIVMQETANIKSYFDEKGSKKLMTNAFITTLIITVCLAGILTFGLLKVWNMHNEQIDQWEAPARYCAEQMAENYEIYSDLMRDTYVSSYLNTTNNETKQRINDKIKDLKPD